MTTSANIARGIAAFFFAASLCADGKEKYSADPISLVVVDFETNQPIAGALVVVRWVAMRSTLHGPRDVGTVEIMDAISSVSGAVQFPGWGPSTYAGDGSLTDEDPVIHVFKWGYLGARLDNSRYGAPRIDDYERRKTGSHRASFWSGERVRLKPFKQDLPRFISVVYNPFVSILDRAVMGAESTPCAWEKIPRAISYMERERDNHVSELGPATRMSSIAGKFLGNEEYFVGKGCRSPRDFLREIGK